MNLVLCFFFFQAEDGIRYVAVTGVQTCALPICLADTIIPSHHREGHARGLARFLETGEGPILRQRIEITALHRDGHEFPVELTVTPMRLGDHWLFGAFEIGRAHV